MAVADKWCTATRTKYTVVVSIDMIISPETLSTRSYVIEIAPEFSISELWWQVLPTAEETNFKTINGQRDLYTAEYLAEVHASGQKAMAWIVNDMDLARDLIKMGIDGITTDYPDKVLALVKAG